MIAQPSPDEVATRIALRALVDEYAARTDAYDYDGFAELFTPDAEFSAVNHGDAEPFFRARGTEELRGVVHGNDQFERTFHAVGNHHLRFEGDEVTGVTYCTAHHLVAGDEPRTLVMLIRYHDAYALGAGGWKFASRRVELVWVEYYEADTSPYPFKHGSREWMDA